MSSCVTGHGIALTLLFSFQILHHVKITGGARGCGLAFARGLAEAGANVAIFDVVDPDTTFYAIEKEYSVRTAYYRVDVSSPESLESGFSQFQKDFNNALDICVPCAGINRHLPFLEFTYNDHHDLVSINMIANGTKHGSIVLVASMASHIAVRSQLCSAYCGTKGAVRAMCPAIAKELAEYFPHLVQGWESEAMNGRIAEPEDIMGACVFLASDANDEGYSTRGPVDASTTVVVVGAGPAGLMLACNLARFGIDVTILDDRPDKTSTGKADGMQPKTIETFKQMRLADPLLRNAARVYDISFWQSTADKPLHRAGRQEHYPERLVGASDPYILLAHQGMVEEVLIDDMEARGVFVMRNSRFTSCSRVAGTGQLDIAYEDLASKTIKTIRAGYLVGCDGARSKVRECIPDAQLEGEVTNASWGVLDGVIDTDFPDLWSKVAVRSDQAGSILWIPRERNMTRLYVQLSETDGERVDRSKATPEYVMRRARDAMRPFRIEWKTIEWFGNYVVGQRVAKRFMDSEARIFIAGDAGHCHSALAAQGANTSMHDSFNLAWKLNLVIRGLAKPSLLSTYEEERQKIAYDLINFDAEHCKAFSQGEAALAKNFDENIRFISGVGAEYSQGLLNRGRTAISTPLQPGTLQLPAKVTRYIDANPVSIQLDIPMLSQFRIYFFIPDVAKALGFLGTICEALNNATGMGKVSSRASQSYATQPQGAAPSDAFIQPQRYTTVSSVFTYAMVTQSSKSEFEIADLPKVLQDSRWTLYLDDIDSPRCTDKWFGSLQSEQVGIVIVRPDGYVGSINTWELTAGTEAGKWIGDYFAFMM
ncbi:FAD binding domain-containing protein [Aspergillus minisclerotigenes]|uniref:FAD binding domain-containing protein n=1 Tax=Aspergillus minisclerotigenes TaxID=656917 RepID=A0A5N6J7U0_9EURO|nr:FAD binding domain-containing protein [Aspergillus minisclerotigenes]